MTKPAQVTVAPPPAASLSNPVVPSGVSTVSSTVEITPPSISNVKPAIIHRTQPQALHNNASGVIPQPAYVKPVSVSHIAVPPAKKTSLHDFPVSQPVSQAYLHRNSEEKDTHPPAVDPIPGANPAETVEQIEHSHVAMHFKEKPITVLGVAFDTYIILQYEDRLLLCDQHAIHERLLFEKFMRETASAPVSQTFLIPLIVQLSRAEYDAFLENRDALEQAGFDAEDFGDYTVQLRGIPFVLGQPQAERCFMDALDELCESGSISQQNKVQRVIQMACKHAVKGGEKLPMDALITLVRRMLTEDIRLTCPHGRPLMVELSKTDLEKRFKRIQN